MLSYMKRLNLPIAFGDDWVEENFDVQSLFYFDPKLAFDLFFDFTSDNAIGRKVNTWTYNENTGSDMLTIMKVLKAEKQLTIEAVADFEGFLAAKLPLETKYGLHQGIDGIKNVDVENSVNKHKHSWKNIYRKYLISSGFETSKIKQTIDSMPILLKLSTIIVDFPIR